MRSRITGALGAIVSRAEELTIPAIHAASDRNFPRLGLTDCIFTLLDPGRFHVLSADLDLILALQAKGFEVTNFQQLVFGELGV